MKILLVDDTEFLRTALRRLLTVMGYEVVTAENATVARNMIENESFDAVVTDNDMKREGDGMHLIADIKQRWPSMVCILMTGAPSPAKQVEANRLGAHFLAKGSETTMENFKRILG